MFSRDGILFTIRYAPLRVFSRPLLRPKWFLPLYSYYQGADIQRVDICVLVVGVQVGVEYRLHFDMRPLESFCAPCCAQSGFPPCTPTTRTQISSEWKKR